LPEHWLWFDQRRSPLSRSPRLAANPANAILNYLYSLAEAEAVIACLRLGLDPGLGLIHQDHKDRNSMALDLMEVVRPAIDGWVLDLLSEPLKARLFTETREGCCRVLPPLTLRLASTTSTWAELLAPVAEHAARVLAASPGSRIRTISTPLTQANRRIEWAGRRGYQSPQAIQTPSVASAPVATKPLNETMPLISGRRRSYGGEAAEKRRDSLARRQQEAAEWEATADRVPGPSEFAQIFEAIQGVPISELVRATGLSRPYCEKIRRGLVVPHPRHWQFLSVQAR
jgi:hypothetical protein